MKYGVTFQQMGQNGRPIDHPSASDFETDDQGFGMIPNVGDYVSIITTKEDGTDGPNFDGKVRSRLFRYYGISGRQSCHINIVVEDAPGDDWGKLIKE